MNSISTDIENEIKTKENRKFETIEMENVSTKITKEELEKLFESSKQYLNYY